MKLESKLELSWVSWIGKNPEEWQTRDKTNKFVFWGYQFAAAADYDDDDQHQNQNQNKYKIQTKDKRFEKNTTNSSSSKCKKSTWVPELS